MISMRTYAARLALLLVLVGSVLLVPQASLAQNAQAIPASAPPGTTITFVSDGFQPNEAITYWISLAPNISYGNVEYRVFADASGRASWQWTIPENALRDTWLMVGRGTQSGVEMQIPFAVLEVPGAPAEPLAAMEPVVGTPETTFRFFARAFETDEDVAYWLNAPTGELVGSRDFRVENEDMENGRIDWEWSPPADAPRGVWSMAARGIDSNIEYLFFFEVR